MDRVLAEIDGLGGGEVGLSTRPEADPYLTFYRDRYIPSYRAELDHFITAVETATQPEPGFAGGRATLALADAAGESLRSGRAVRVGA